MPGSVYGYTVRPPYPGEEDFFRSRPEVAGMAAQDGQITLNPYSGLSSAEQAAVAKNEAIRLWQKDNREEYAFPVAPHQRSFFSGTEYEPNEPDQRNTIVARILSGDMSAGPYTNAQRGAADMTKLRIDKMIERLR